MTSILAVTHTRQDGPTGSTGATRSPLVLVHGVGLDLRMWDLVVEAMAVDRAVVRYDLWGHGATADPPGLRSVEDFVDQCKSVINEVSMQHGGLPDLVGLSLGGLIALGVAARYPDSIRRVVAMNTVFERTEEQTQAVQERLRRTESEGLEMVASLAVDRWFSGNWQKSHPELVEAVRSRIVTNDLDSYLKAYRLFVGWDQGLVEATTKVTAPLLALTGELDVGSTPAMSAKIASTVGNGRSRVLSGLRHLPPIEAPEKCVTALQEFLDDDNEVSNNQPGEETW